MTIEVHRPAVKNETWYLCYVLPNCNLPITTCVFIGFFFFLIMPGQNTIASEEILPFEQLIAEMEHPDPNRSWDAVNALGASGDKRAVPLLMKALEKDMTQRTGIALAIIPALGFLRDERTVPLLLKALNNTDVNWPGREVAARALGDIGSKQAVPDLIRAAWLPETRNAAIEALAGIGDPRATDVLLSALSEEEDTNSREAAITGLIRIGANAVPALIDKLNVCNKEYTTNYERALAAMILGRIGDMRAVNSLNRALNDPNPKVRKSAESALEYLMNG
ncbi:MAG: HEAT repeat domain-containing protein [Desulfovermiculus sp.]|nr:HEAT repeat domain-containing protein [Desulfovermiculus sp.]